MYSIRGAITISSNDQAEIYQATQEMLREILVANDVGIEDFNCLFFSCTKDITKAYPGPAARDMGFSMVPIMCLQEMHVEDSLAMCIRVMALINKESPSEKVKHVYLREAKSLRVDLISKCTTI